MDQAFSVPICVRLERMSEKSYKLIRKMFAAISEITKEELVPILGKKPWVMLVGTSRALKGRNREDQH